MDLYNSYLMMNYLSGLNSVYPTGSLYPGASSTSSLGGTLSFLEIFQNLQKEAEKVSNTEKTSSGEFSSNLTAGASMDAIFERAAAKYDVDVDLLKAIGKAESNFNASAVSSAGAMGVMQLMPGTARSLGVTDPYDAEQNIMGGAKYISQMLDRYDGNMKLALAAYNAGPGNVDKYNGIPPFAETQNYVEKVMGYLEKNTSETTTASGSNAASDTIEIKTDTLITLYNLMRAQMELQLANSMFAWNTGDSSGDSLLSF